MSLGRKGRPPLDAALLMSVTAVAIVGWLTLVSATSQDGRIGPDALRQGMFLLGGLGLVAVGRFVDYRILAPLSIPLYGLALAGLAAVMVPGIGQSSRGAQRWISAGPLGTLQPSEIAKLAVIVSVAALLAWRGREETRRAGGFVSMVSAGALAVLPFALVLLQPDLGTALVIVAIVLVQVFVAGTSPAWLVAIIGTGAVCVPHVLKEYQRDRLLVFLDPEHDPQGLGYNLVQSKIAIGSGGMWGSGLFAGQMSQLHFVPEQRTDFIFSVLGEELGFVGSIGLLALYLVLLLCILRVALRSRDLFGTLLATGTAALLAFHVVVNMGMTMGLLPVVGIPLPLVSYGGTAVLTDLAAVAIVASVYAHSQERANPYHLSG